MTIKSTFLSALAALLVSGMAVGSAVAPAQAVTLPVQTLANA